MTTIILWSSVFASAFSGENQTNLTLRWKTGVIPIAFSNSLIKSNPNIKFDSDVKNALRRSLNAWEKAADIKFESVWSDKQSVSPKGNFGDGISLITIAQTPENLLLFSRDANDVSARTRVFYNKKGIITEADIVLNPYQQFSTDGSFGTFDLETTLTHEIGHLLGLEHSSVFGSTMYANKGKNGVFNLPSFDGRSLELTDISAVRALYGSRIEDDKCCGRITGKIESETGESTTKALIWVEESESGRVVAAENQRSSDGSFSLGGLPTGKYKVFVQKNVDSENLISAQEIGIVDVIKNKSATLTKVVKKSYPSKLQYLGFNGQLSAVSVPVNAGKTYTIFVGGKNLDPNLIKIGFNSPFISATPGSLAAQNFGSDVSVVSFEIRIESECVSGEYSLFVESPKGQKEYIVGGISVEEHANPWSNYNLPNTDD